MDEREIVLRIERLEARVRELKRAQENRSARLAPPGRAGTAQVMKFGTLAANWVPGANEVELDIGTEETITATILPGQTHCPSIGVHSVGDTAGYVSRGDRHYLFNHPQLPRTITPFHVLRNDEANNQPHIWRARHLAAHSIGAQSWNQAVDEETEWSALENAQDIGRATDERLKVTRQTNNANRFVPVLGSNTQAASYWGSRQFDVDVAWAYAGPNRTAGFVDPTVADQTGPNGCKRLTRDAAWKPLQYNNTDGWRRRMYRTIETVTKNEDTQENPAALGQKALLQNPGTTAAVTTHRFNGTEWVPVGTWEEPDLLDSELAKPLFCRPVGTQVGDILSVALHQQLRDTLNKMVWTAERAPVYVRRDESGAIVSPLFHERFGGVDSNGNAVSGTGFSGIGFQFVGEVLHSAGVSWSYRVRWTEPFEIGELPDFGFTRAITVMQHFQRLVRDVYGNGSTLVVQEFDNLGEARASYFGVPSPPAFPHQQWGASGFYNAMNVVAPSRLTIVSLGKWGSDQRPTKGAVSRGYTPNAHGRFEPLFTPGGGETFPVAIYKYNVQGGFTYR